MVEGEESCIRRQATNSRTVTYTFSSYIAFSRVGMHEKL